MKRPITTTAEALAAVRHNGWSLKDVPKHLKTQDVCLAAVRREELAMPYVPDGMQDGLRQLLLAVRAGQGAGNGAC